MHATHVFVAGKAIIYNMVSDGNRVTLKIERLNLIINGV